ncbi:MAG: DUF975 family protein [Clostridia bacterium]|jgi:uncharacterized membrane protein|nr:DUF975 family protein [Clostridia bacterium]MBQ5792425.1 DUF975 family protein [Clostridia bacterium]
MIKAVKAKARELVIDNLAGSIFAFFLLVVLTVLLDATGIGAIFSGVVAFGYAIFCLELIKTKKAKIGTFFSGIFKGFFKKWAAGFLMGLYTFLWSLLFLIPGFVKYYAYSMTPYIMAEKPNMSINDAITKSREIMKGHKWQLFLLDLSFTGWMILSALTLGLALVYVWPYYNAARAAFYKEIKKSAK